LPESVSEIDLETIKNRLREASSPLDPDPDETDRLFQNQMENGSWPDIDYADRSRTHWAPSTHLSRLHRLAWAHRLNRSESPFERAILTGLNYWIEQDPESDNWFHNIIGVPREMGGFLLFAADIIPREQQDIAEQMVRRSGFTRTGANLVWEAGNLVSLACAIDDRELLREASGRISEEVRYSVDEGIQSDYSFHQHGPQNNIGSYGQSFASQISRYAALFADTSLAFPSEKIRILSGLILEGQQWFVWGRQADFHAMGRRVFRSTGPWTSGWSTGNADQSAGYVPICDSMRVADPGHSQAYQDFAARLVGEQSPAETGPLGNRHFWRSDTMVHRSEGYYGSVRMHSTRTRATEIRVNRENLRGYHLADGVYFIMRRGDEFHGIQPIWDYRKLPGLTYVDTEAAFPYGEDGFGTTSFVGGVSDGSIGIAAMDYAKDEVRARKCYFFDNAGLICLGAGICADTDRHTITTMNQCLLKSNIAILRDGDLTDLESVTCDISDLQGVHHDGVGYLMLEPGAVTVNTGPQSGSWRDIEEGAVITDLVTQDVFRMEIDHGHHVHDARYAYRILPGITRDTFAATDPSDTVDVLSNTSTCQAIRWGRNIGVVFYEAGQLAISATETVAVDVACMILMNNSDEAVHLTLSDPTQEQRFIQVTVSGHYAGKGATYSSVNHSTTLTAELPTGAYSGQSAQHELSFAS
jgi:chondroitin AC lyase